MASKSLASAEIDAAFEDWWKRIHIPTLTTSEAYAAAKTAWSAGAVYGSNYVADHDTFPQKITFANGRVVAMKGQGHLFVALDP